MIMSVLLAKKYSNPTHDIDGEIRQRLPQGKSDTFIYVVPTKRKVRELQRELLHLLPTKTNPAFHLFTLETLALRLYPMLCIPKKIVSGPAQAVLMRKAFNIAKEELRYFVVQRLPGELPKGTFSKIIDVINNLKEAGVYPSILYQELASAEIGEYAKLHDILKIYEQYEQVLGERFIDLGGIYKELNNTWQVERATSLFRKNFPRVDTVFIAGFDEFSDPEITLLDHLLSLDGIGMVISFDYSPANDELFGHLRENYQKFLQLGFQEHSRRASPIHTTPESNFREFLSANLFRRNPDASIDCKDSITLLWTSDRLEEVVLIAKCIKHRMRTKPISDLSKICVAMYQPQVYTNLFREVFARYGIPANLTDRYALDQSPLVVAIVSLLQVWSNNFRQRDVMRALSSPYFDFRLNNREIDAGNLYEVSIRLKIPGGREYWRRRIQQRIAQISDEVLETDDEVSVEELRREEERLRKAMRDIQTLESLLRRFDGQLTPIQFKDRLVRLLDELNVPAQLLCLRTSLSEEHLEKDTRAYQKFLYFLDEFLTIVALQEEEGLRERYTAALSGYLQELRAALSQVRYNVRQRYGYGVYVTSLEETRGLQFDVMFIAGLVDGEFPPGFQPEIFFSQTRQQKEERYHLIKHRYLFFQGVSNFTGHLYLSYPQKDEELELIPSSFLDAFHTVVKCEEWRENIPGELTLPVYSEDEFLQRMGKNIGAVLLEEGGGGKVPSFDDLPGGDALSRYDEILEHIRHAVEVDHSRTKSHVLAEYEGIIEEKLTEEAKRRLGSFRNKVYSVSQLESYGKCPFQYFAGKVLRLNVLKELEEGLTPLERGGVIHEILFTFYVARRKNKLPPLFECSDIQFERAVNDLLSIARKKLDELNVPDVLWDIDKEMFLGGENKKGMLQTFLEGERERRLDVRPAYFEVAFGPRVGGKKQSDPLIRHDEVISAGNVQLRGKVDRIEVGESAFTIVDYKTGMSTPKLEDIALGVSLQLPLYLYAVEEILSEKVGGPLTPAAGVYYRLQDAKDDLGLGNAEFKNKAFRLKTHSNQLLKNDEELRRVVDQAIQFVNSYVDGISKGDFRLTTPEKAEKVCRHCDFQRVCRIQTQMPGVLR